jgi:hypothetical protein
MVGRCEGTNVSADGDGVGFSEGSGVGSSVGNDCFVVTVTVGNSSW